MKKIEFNYDLQVWIVDGIIQRCGHPESMDCGCVALTFCGRTAEYALNVLAEVA